MFQRGFSPPSNQLNGRCSERAYPPGIKSTAELLELLINDAAAMERDGQPPQKRKNPFQWR